MASTYHKQSIQRAPEFTLYKTVADAPDGGGPYTEKKHGVDTTNYLNTVVEIAPSATANPAVTILFWSEVLGRFVADDDLPTIAAKGAGVAYQKVVNSAGRRIFVEVAGTVPAASSVQVRLAGSELEHP